MESTDVTGGLLPTLNGAMPHRLVPVLRAFSAERARLATGSAKRTAKTVVSSLVRERSSSRWHSAARGTSDRQSATT